MFQDRLVLVLWSCLQAHHPRGRPVLQRLFEQMFARGLLVPAVLDDLAILLLIAACPDNSPLRGAVNVAFVARGLHLTEAIPGLREATWRVRLSCDPELVAVSRHGTTEQRAQAEVIIRRAHGPRLRLFLGLLFHTAAVAQEEAARQSSTQTFATNRRIPLGTIDFMAHLYRVFVTNLPLEDLPESLPSPLPTWFAALSEEERRFLVACVGLPRRNHRLLVYLCMYARLDLAQLTVAASGRSQLSEDAALHALENAFNGVLATWQ